MYGPNAARQIRGKVDIACDDLGHRTSIRRSRAGVFRRRHGGRHHHCAVTLQFVVRDRPQFELYLKGKGGRHQKGRPRTRRALRAGRKRPKAGGRARITGQLIDAASGVHLWADTIDGELTDVFELHDRITTSVVSSIAPKIEQAEIERVRQNPTNVPDSYDSYLQGLALASRGQGAEARSLFKRAIEQDPLYAAAHAMAAYTYLVDHAQHGAIADAGMRYDAVALANAALKLANQDAFVLARSAQALTYLGLEYYCGGLAGREGDCPESELVRRMARKVLGFSHAG